MRQYFDKPIAADADIVKVFAGLWGEENLHYNISWESSVVNREKENLHDNIS